MKQKHVGKTLSSVVFSAECHIFYRHIGAGEKSFKVNFLGNKSSRVIILPRTLRQTVSRY